MHKPWPHQRKAIDELSNGSVLVGETGSGKTLVGLAYFYERIIGGSIDPPLMPERSVDLYVITTAMKRDRLDWQREAAQFALSKDREASLNQIKVTVDSWNNIGKYLKVKGAFFIFDEQRTVGYKTWGRAFIKIAKKNSWVMLTATPADSWMDLVSVFVANGFYRNKTHFIREHVEYVPHIKFPKIRRYHKEWVLRAFKNKIFVVMKDLRPAVVDVRDIVVDHPEETIRDVNKREWNPFKDQPIMNLPEHVAVIRRLVNTDVSRITALQELVERVGRLIIFYNFDYELELLRTAFRDVVVAEHNGHKHEPLPEGEAWVYLVQYMSGNEAWECFTTNHMAFYSLNYSYRIMTQAMGRINRLTSPYKTLHYYRLLSESDLDKMILRALSEKRTFNIKDLKIE